MKFFKFYERSAHGALLVFAGSYIKFLHKSLKLTDMFFCFVFCFFFLSRFYCQVEPEMRFFKFYGKLTHNMFLVFCITLQLHKGLK